MADDTTVMSVTDYDLATEIAKNIADENTAIEGYYALLAFMTEIGAGPEDIAQVREIISDEKNHRTVLAEMSLKYDGAIPTAED